MSGTPRATRLAISGNVPRLIFRKDVFRARCEELHATTDEECAALIGVGTRTLYRWYASESLTIPYPTLKAVAARLSLAVDDLVGPAEAAEPAVAA